MQILIIFSQCLSVFAFYMNRKPLAYAYAYASIRFYRASE